MVAMAGGWNPARGRRVRGTTQRELEKWGAGSGALYLEPIKGGARPGGSGRVAPQLTRREDEAQRRSQQASGACWSSSRCPLQMPRCRLLRGLDRQGSGL